MELLQDIYFTNLNAVCHLGGLFAIKSGMHWSIGTNTFNQNKFYYITKGRCVINIDGKEYNGDAGKWFFIPANKPHSYYNIDTEPFQKYWMHFDLYPNSTSIFDLLKLPYCVDVGKGKRAKELFSELIRADKSTNLADKMRVKSRILDLLAEYILLAQPHGFSVTSESDIRINNILSYINDNLDKTITNENLSEVAHMHPNHMIRFFKKKTDQTPAKYVNTKKLEYAKTLLEESDTSITEIMEKIGIGDLSHFSKLFKSFYDMSPANYRKYFKNDNAKSLNVLI